MTAEVSAASPISVSPPTYLTDFVSIIPTGFVDLLPGGRLLVLDGVNQGGSSTVHVVLNWFTALREKVRSSLFRPEQHGRVGPAGFACRSPGRQGRRHQRQH